MQKSRTSILTAFLFIVVVVSLGFSGFLFYQNNQLKLSNASKTQAAPPTLPANNLISPTPTAQEYKIAKYGSLFSYEYPYGWHVGVLWQQNQGNNGNGVIIAIDPNPINTAPRGGPLATFEISILSGNDNPDELLAERMNDFNPTNYTDITQETLSADIGEIYHYKGKISGEMYKGEPVESYFFTFNQNPSDPINQQVVVATLVFKDDPELSAMLKHIVLSFKKLTP